MLGAEDGYGPHAAPGALREAVARIAVTHARKDALELFSRESRAPGVSFAPGTTSGSALTLNGRAAVEPRYRLYSCLVAKERLAAPRVVIGQRQEAVPVPCGGAPVPPGAAAPSAGRGAAQPVPPDAGVRHVPLIALAYGRSGDKGDTSNIAVIARRPEDLALLRRVLTPERVRAYLAHLVHGEVTRYEVPGLGAFNFLMTEALDGGGPSSLRPDPMGKGMAQLLLGMPVPVG